MAWQNFKISIAKLEDKEGGIIYIMSTDETPVLSKFWGFDSQVIYLNFINVFY
jgi:hypothetical protein